jgi:ResB-like family
MILFCCNDIVKTHFHKEVIPDKSMYTMFVTISCLIAALILVFVSTLAQVKMDPHEVEQTMLRTFFIWWHGIPVFPGGITIALALLINLTISVVKRGFWKKKPLLMIHMGFALLIVGEILRMVSAEESFLVLHKAHQVNYSESGTELELALIDHSSGEHDVIKSITLNEHTHNITPFNEPLCITLNSDTYDVEGYGTWPLIKGTRQFGSCEISLRRKRTYQPYSITLNSFNYEIHPGSNIPKSFSSDITISDEETNTQRQVQISMNSPLHYKGKTFYQENYANEGETSVLHVVENRWKSLPYVSIMIIAIGLTLNIFNVLRKGR